MRALPAFLVCVGLLGPGCGGGGSAADADSGGGDPGDGDADGTGDPGGSDAGPDADPGAEGEADAADAADAPADDAETTGDGGGLDGLPLLVVDDLRYVGAFRVPEGAFGGSSFGYGGRALAFNPGRPSLYVVGHAWDQMVAEIDIPAAAPGADLGALPVATVLQPFVEPTGGLMFTVDEDTIEIGGLVVAGGELVGSAYTYYDADGDQVLSHFVRPLDLSAPGVRGMFQVGELGAGLVSGYFAEVPEAWREALGTRYLNGQCCIPIISRTSYGPAAFGIDPADLGPGGPAPAAPFVYYPAAHPLSAWDSTSRLFNGSTQVRGLVFPAGTRSVLFFGRQGTGTFCYGTGEECADPVETYHGTHAYPYVYQVWAYDALDFLAVRRGDVEPWDVRPYATWEPSLPFGVDGAEINGAAYDPSSGRIWITQAFGDGDRPVVYEFAVEPG